MTRANTHQKIKAAFIALLQEKDYPDITVREIAERADIGFKTFYRHYDDKSAIANVVYVDTWSQLLGQIRKLGLNNPPEEILQHLATTIQEQAPLMRAFVALGSYQHVLPEIVIEFAQEQIQVYRPDLFESDHAYAKSLQSAVITYFMTGQVELIRWWLLQDDMNLPLEAVMSMMYQLVIHPIMQFEVPNNMLDK